MESKDNCRAADAFLDRWILLLKIKEGRIRWGGHVQIMTETPSVKEVFLGGGRPGNDMEEIWKQCE